MVAFCVLKTANRKKLNYKTPLTLNVSRAVSGFEYTNIIERRWSSADYKTRKVRSMVGNWAIAKKIVNGCFLCIGVGIFYEHTMDFGRYG